MLPLVVLDLWTKAWAFAAVAEQSPTIRKTNGITYQEQRIPVDFLPDPFGFALVRLRNTGTVWGLAQDSTIILMVLRCIAVLALVWFARKTEVRHRLQQLTLGGILAGALGNLYDNFFCLNRGVRDFLYLFRLDEEGVEHGFPAFNAADSYITVGAVLLLISMWFQPASNPAHNPN
ncbi:MAG: signal peptidase II [Planctomycetota bacterium]